MRSAIADAVPRRTFATAADPPKKQPVVKEFQARSRAASTTAHSAQIYRWNPDTPSEKPKMQTYKVRRRSHRLR